MEGMTDTCPRMLVSQIHKNIDFVVHVGLDVHSCTSTAAAVAFWLCPPADGLARSMRELSVEHSVVPLSSLTSDTAIADLLQSVFNTTDTAWLLIFSTAPHKFVVLCQGQEAVLIQSNQDDTRGGKPIRLDEWMASDVPRWSHLQLAVFIRRMAEATTGAVDHEDVCAEYFGGCRFKRGNASEYWVIVLPVTAH